MTRLNTDVPVPNAAAQAVLDKIQWATERVMRAKAEELEARIRRGCTGCRTALMTDKFMPVPGSTIIYRHWTEAPPHDVGSPYCGMCLHRMGLCCEPGDDYSI